MTDAPNLSQARTQGAMHTPANYKPKNNPGYYNPNDEMQSSLYRANKRPFIAPLNFIGKNTIRPDNMQPVRTYNPGGISGPHTIDVPQMRTMLVQPKFQ